MEALATYTGMGCLGEIAKKGAGTVYLFDMLSNKQHKQQKSREALC